MASNRMEALLRVWAFIWQGHLGYVLSVVFGIVGIIFMIVDVIWQLVWDSDGLDSQSTLSQAIQDAYQWNIGQTLFAFTSQGDGEFRWHPWV